VARIALDIRTLRYLTGTTTRDQRSMAHDPGPRQELPYRPWSALAVGKKASGRWWADLLVPADVGPSSGRNHNVVLDVADREAAASTSFPAPPSCSILRNRAMRSTTPCPAPPAPRRVNADRMENRALPSGKMPQVQSPARGLPLIGGLRASSAS
jgi:hypothetical protein